jgi:hypothetical protein
LTELDLTEAVMNGRKVGNLIVLAMALTAVTILPAATHARRGADGATEIAIPERANAYASIAANGRFAALVWGATTAPGVTDIYVATSRDGGRSFGEPGRVNQVPGEAGLSGEQPPRIALTPRESGTPMIVVVWTARAPKGTRLLTVRSEDGGRSFGAAVPIPGGQASGNRGWESLAPTRDGGVAAVWLDHREAAGRPMGVASAHAEHQHVKTDGQTSDGVARAQRSQLFFARVDKPSSQRSVTAGVCYCCKTAVAAGQDGRIYVAWRHVYAGNVRDIAFSMSVDDGRTFQPPVRVSDDRWVLDGCPENGPALTVDRGNRIHVVWPTVVPGATSASEPTMALFHAMSRDGRAFTARHQIPTEGIPRHPQVVALPSRGEIVVVWDEQASGSRRIALARGTIDSNGSARFRRQPVEAWPASASYPAVAAVDGGIVVAWTSGSGRQTVVRVEKLAD